MPRLERDGRVIALPIVVVVSVFVIVGIAIVVLVGVIAPVLGPTTTVVREAQIRAGLLELANAFAQLGGE